MSLCLENCPGCKKAWSLLRGKKGQHVSEKILAGNGRLWKTVSCETSFPSWINIFFKKDTIIERHFIYQVHGVFGVKMFWNWWGGTPTLQVTLPSDWPLPSACGDGVHFAPVSSSQATATSFCLLHDLSPWWGQWPLGFPSANISGFPPFLLPSPHPLSLTIHSLSNLQADIPRIPGIQVPLGHHSPWNNSTTHIGISQTSSLLPDSVGSAKMRKDHTQSLSHVYLGIWV